MQRRRTNESASALIWTVCVITVLSLVAAQLLRAVPSKYPTVLQTATWQEALLAGESGIDLAILELRKTLYPAPNQAWDGWSVPTEPPSTIERHALTLDPVPGTTMKVDVSVDAPLQLKDPVNSWQYYRIRAAGTMLLAGPIRASDNKQDTRLRKLSLRSDRFTNGLLTSHEVAKPEVTRRIEAIVRPVSAFDLAIMADGALDLTDQNIIIDSYDSRDPLKSTNGLYPGTTATNPDGSFKRQQNGDIATNGQLLNAGNARVNGDVATNSGTVTGVANVTGVQRDDFYQDPIPVAAPNWSSINPSPSIVAGTVSLAANAVEDSTASRYQLSSITLSGNQVLTLTGNPDGSATYIDLYVTGDFVTTGLAQVILDPGVHARIYAGGNISIAGNGVVNKNNQPGDLLFYGITPPTGTSRSIQISGNSQLSAAVYAPSANVEINNGGTRGSVYGSFVGKTVKMNGVTDLHYDEALGAGGTINNYKIVSWFEDTR